MNKLDVLLELPFEEYMAGCWSHVVSLANNDPVASIVASHLFATPAQIEALWARRYWFHKVNTLEQKQNVQPAYESKPSYDPDTWEYHVPALRKGNGIR